MFSIEHSNPPIIQITDPKHAWAVSDPHFDHTNIIEYCSRPFASVQEMNEVILYSMREVIDANDFVLFLGDMAFGRGSRKPRWWLGQLPGQIVYLKGSHDKGIRPTSTGLNAWIVTDAVIIEVENLRIYSVHDPVNVPGDWRGWILHGHTHDTTPYIDPLNRRINVSLDVTEFKPVRFDKIVEIVRKEKYAAEKGYNAIST